MIRAARDATVPRERRFFGPGRRLLRSTERSLLEVRVFSGHEEMSGLGPVWVMVMALSLGPRGLGFRSETTLPGHCVASECCRSWTIRSAGVLTRLRTGVVCRFRGFGGGRSVRDLMIFSPCRTLFKKGHRRPERDQIR